MKKIFYVSMMLVTAAGSSCKKEKPTVQVTVIDKVTNTPITNASVFAYKCGTFNCYFGRIDLFTGTSDNNGICKIPADAYNEAAYVGVSKGDYWSTNNDDKNTTKYMLPAGWIRLHILRSANYPAQSVLNMQMTSQSISPYYFFTQQSSTPADSSVLIKLLGGQSNKIEWQVVNLSSVLNSGTWTQQVPRLDTVNITLNY